jgi:RNA-binding protein
MELTKPQRNHLRGLANSLPITVTVGKQGLTESIVEKTRQELAAHELIKLRFLDFFDQQRQLVTELSTAVDAVAVAIIGHTAILYRRSDDSERRRIVLPPGGVPWDGKL